MVEPTRINKTKLVNFVVVSMACFNSFISRRPRIKARIVAPTAPIAPPSVGVATPIKIVPSTRKIKNNGGIITKTTRSAICDKSFKPNSLFKAATAKATVPHKSKPTTIFSSTGAFSLSNMLSKK